MRVKWQPSSSLLVICGTSSSSGVVEVWSRCGSGVGLSSDRTEFARSVPKKPSCFFKTRSNDELNPLIVVQNFLFYIPHTKIHPSGDLLLVAHSTDSLADFYFTDFVQNLIQILHIHA
ncbi:hypothetical protein AVEN_40850-1 [Araneus ventricosus]|uniref:Uncharacterized protein n=1 Tax=Araneus ventricosus TaxID=182803 RepID=A0A4Y2MCP1_ARAVE|nr:hypothetical protein AVEN_40850-1 [Araneus ventricosus]